MGHIVFALAALVAAATATEAPVGKPAPAATVTFVAGEATRTAAGSALALAVGSTLAEGDVVETGSRSRVELELADGSSVRLAPGSRLVIAAAVVGPAPDQRRFSLKLALGTLWAHVVRALGPDSRFEVETESAVAGVRGTSFEVSAGGDGSAAVRVHEGKVAVWGGEGAERWEHLATTLGEVRVDARRGRGKLGRFEPAARDEWHAWNRERDRVQRERAGISGGKDGPLHERKQEEKPLRRRLERHLH